MSTGVAVITVEAVELKLTTILTILWTIFGIMTVVAGALYVRGRRATAAPPPAAAYTPPAPRKAFSDSPAEAAALEEAHRVWLDGLSGSTNWEHLSDSGRHHLPEDLLDLPTYQLGPDRVARAKVPEQN